MKSDLRETIRIDELYIQNYPKPFAQILAEEFPDESAREAFLAQYDESVRSPEYDHHFSNH